MVTLNIQRMVICIRHLFDEIHLQVIAFIYYENSLYYIDLQIFLIFMVCYFEFIRKFVLSLHPFLKSSYINPMIS